MRKRKRKEREQDVNVLAFNLVQRSTGEPIPIVAKKKKNPAAVALGRLGGLKGGKARCEKLSPERRRQIASNAARKRWAKEKNA